MSLTDKIVTEFETLKGEKAGVAQMREQAFDAFSKLGIPGMRHEEWKYTNIKTQLPETLSLIGKNADAQVKYSSFGSLNAIKLVFVNGVYNAQLSELKELKGLTIVNLKEAFAKHTQQVEERYGKLIQLNEEHFAALNTAFATDGVFIHVAKNTVIELPVLTVHLFTGGENFVQSHNLIVAEQGASINLIEDFENAGSAAYFNHVSEVYVGANATVNVTELHTETKNTTGIHTLEAELAADSRFNCTSISFEGKLIRNNINARLRGQNSEAHLYGLYYGKGDTLIDNHILVDHIVPNCQSNQLYKGVLDDQATGVFNGKIFVKQDAQKTNAFQSSKAILLSEEAAINSKPQLEIFADDVKCSHGAAIGQLGDNEVFYLRARGIEEADAKAMLTFAFANDIIETISVAELKEHLSNKLRERLGLSE